MARTNICKDCGIGPELPEGVFWVGTNHNLCNVCADDRPNKKAGFTVFERRTSRTPGLNSLAMVALLGAALVAPAEHERIDLRPKRPR
jgi:hypothetical protein